MAEDSTLNTNVLGTDFFARPALEVAPDLLGKVLVRKIGGQKIFITINEVEAYDGFEDKASHASKGKTKRNEVMFFPGGYFYIYLVYGIHNMLNIVTGEKEYPEAVLIRGGKEINGPGRLTKFLKVDRGFNKKIVSPSTGLWLQKGEKEPLKKEIKKTPRIGVDYAGPVWSKKLYRYILK